MNIFLKTKKGISPVVATSLLLVVAVSAVVFFQGWFTDFSSQVLVDVESDASTSLTQVGVNDVIGSTLYVNAGSNLSIDKIEINGFDCNYNGSISGLSKINISACLENVTGGANVVVFTNQGVYESYEFVDSDSAGNLNGGSGLGSTPFSVSNDLNHINFGSYPGYYDMPNLDNVYKGEFYSSKTNPGGLVVGAELSKFNGTDFELVEDVTVGPSNSHPRDFYNFNDEKLYFNAQNASNSQIGYVYDGVSVIEIPNTNVVTDGIRNFGDFGSFQGDLFFSAYHSTWGGELYRIVGSNISLVEDIRPGTSSSWPTYFIEFQNNLYFEADDGSVGDELYVYDGSSVSLVQDINPGPGNGVKSKFVEYNNKLYFMGDNGSTGNELFSFDGSTVSLVEDINVGSSSSSPAFLTVFNNKLYFKAFDGINGSELYVYDGTNVNLLYDFFVGSSSSNPEFLFVHDNYLFFTARTGASNAQRAFYIDNSDNLVDITDNLTGWQNNNGNVIINYFNNKVQFLQWTY